MFDTTENNKIDFETIDYSKVNPKKLNGNKRIVKSYLIYFAFDVVLTVAIFLLTLFKLIDSSDNHGKYCDIYIKRNIVFVPLC